jgi:hypothetical protein
VIKAYLLVLRLSDRKDFAFRMDESMKQYYSNCNKTQFPEGFVRFGAAKCSLPLITQPGPNTPLLTDFKPRSDDIFLTGFSKSGIYRHFIAAVSCKSWLVSLEYFNTICFYNTINRDNMAE